MPRKRQPAEVNKGPFTEGHGLVPGAALYQKVREAISVKQFTGEDWPAAEIDQSGVKAMATVQPDPESLVRLSGTELQHAKAKMWELVRGMDDATADVLDAVSCLWINQASSKDQMVWLTADQFLAFRGLQLNRNAAGRESGYKDHQRRMIAEQLVRLENTWIDVMEMEMLEEYHTKGGEPRRRRRKWKGRSRALIRSSEVGQTTLDGGIDPYAWRIRPGDVFSEFLLGPGRDVVLLSRKALEYDPYRQDVEKRLARYFAYHWRTASEGGSPRFTVIELLEAAHKPFVSRRAQDIKRRLEQAILRLALDDVITIPGLYDEAHRLMPEVERRFVAQVVPELCAAGRLVIGDFLYGDAFPDEEVGTAGWAQRWLQMPVRIAPPPILLSLYAEGVTSVLPKPGQGESAQPDSSTKAVRRDLVARFIEVREKRGMAKADAAAELGVSKSLLTLVESRSRKPSKKMAQLMEEWLNRTVSEV